MSAAFILLPAFVIGLIAWATAWLYTRSSPATNQRDELRRLTHYAAWLEQRLDTARRERWDPSMIVSLSTQLGAACHQLSRAQRNARRPRNVVAH